MRPAENLLIVVCWLFASVAAAQSYPSKPINLVVGFPPGGGADIVARIIGQKLSDNWNQPIVVFNRPGADSNIAYESVSQAPPDGYTLLLVTTELAINPSLYGRLPYDPLKDFVAITPAASSPYVLVVHPSIPARSVKELIVLAKAKPGTLNYASGAAGVHLASELFKSMAGVDMVRIAYKGGPQAMFDVIAGNVSLMFPPISIAYPHVQSGKFRALGLTGAQRSRFAPELPTVAESGLAGYEASQWWGVVTRAGTPRNIVNKLNTEIVKILGAPDIRERFSVQRFEVTSSTPEQFTAYIQAETAKWAKVVKDSGARIN